MLGLGQQTPRRRATMPRIENVAVENEIASSLLSPAEQELERAAPEQQPSEYTAHGDDLLNEAINEGRENVIRDGDEAYERLRSERLEPEERESGRQERQPQDRSQQAEAHAGQEQAPEPTAQQVQEGIAALDA